MSRKNVLFISGSIGLGHVNRDLAIGEALRRQVEGLSIDWLAASPADQVIQEAGEVLLPQSSHLVDESEIAESFAKGAHLNLIRYAFGARGEWSRNVEVVDRVTAAKEYDLVIGDETYEILLAYKKDPSMKRTPFVMVFDFVGLDAMTRNPMERLGAYLWNMKWSSGGDRASEFVDLSLFVGEPEDVPDTRFGAFLPNRREWAEAHCEFVGYVFPFHPGEFADRKAFRRLLGYDDGPLVVCSIGGTSIGKDLLELCGMATPLLKERIPGLKVVLVCGPRLDPDVVAIPEGIEIRGYVPRLYEHLAASDMAIVQGGGTVTLELTALRKPFLYFPIEGHSEQEVHVAGRVRRHGAGRRMEYSSTSPEDLAGAIVEALDSEAEYPSIPVDGAEVAAGLIKELL